MMLKTHVMIALFVVLFFISFVSHPFVFVLSVLVATVIPDLDSNTSSYGRHTIFRPLQFFVRHRGIIHSFTTAVVLSLLLAIKWPVISFGFFVGYSIHLLSDSFTKEGIQPFWPLHFKSYGPLVTGGRIEESLFFLLIFVNAFIFFITIILR
mgnify:CR=1 FL=1